MRSQLLHDTLSRHVDSGSLPGLVALVAEADRVHIEVIGTKSFDDPSPMTRDSIFRIASITKPIAAAAAMMLVDDGALSFDANVEEWLPELAGQRVLRHIDAALDDTVPANRPITVEDVLTYRLGFGNIMVRPDTYPIQAAEVSARLTTLGPPWPPSGLTADQWIAAFASLPLMYQPGEQWLYNTGGQVLGVLIERAAGKPLEAFMRERLFEPLGMTDTAFSVPLSKRDRLTTCYSTDPTSGEIRVLDTADSGSFWAEPPAMANAAGWLVSTIDDLWSFVRMIIDGGAAGHERLLTTASIDLMTTDHLTAQQRANGAMFLDGGGWGYGMRVPDTATRPHATGLADGCGWDGGTGTMWRTSPVTGRTGILLTQRCMTSPEPPPIFRDFAACTNALFDNAPAPR